MHELFSRKNICLRCGDKSIGAAFSESDIPAFPVFSTQYTLCSASCFRKSAIPILASRTRRPMSWSSAFVISSSTRFRQLITEFCKSASVFVIVSETNSGRRTRNSRPFLKSHASSTSSKNASTCSYARVD